MSSQRSRRSPRKSQSQRSQSSQRTQQDSDSGFVDPALQTGRTMKKVCKENFLEAWNYCQTGKPILNTSYLRRHRVAALNGRIIL